MDAVGFRSRRFLAASALVALSLALCVLLAALIRPARGPVESRDPPAAVAPSRGAVAPEAVEVRAPDDAPSSWTISGRVLREGPLAAARVRLEPESGARSTADPPPGIAAVTGADGRFELRGVEGLQGLLLTIDHPGAALWKARIRLPLHREDRRHDLGDITLGRSHALMVKLLGPDGGPLGGGKVVVRMVSIGGVASHGDLDIEAAWREAGEVDGGEHFLDRLGPGRYEVVAHAPGHEWSNSRAHVPSPKPLVIRLDKACPITGTVRSRDGRPIEGAVLLPAGSITDASGRFSMDAACLGFTDLWAIAEGYSSMARRARGGDGEVEFTLLREAVIAGRVISAEDRKPIGGAEVRVSRVEGCDARTDHEGRFTISKVPPGKHEVFAHGLRFTPANVLFEVREGDSLEGVEIALLEGLSIEGEVLDSEGGGPISRAKIATWMREKDDHWTWKYALSDAGGRFTLSGLREGEYTLKVSAPGYLELEEVISLSPESARVSLILGLGGSIAGRIIDPDGSPVPGSWVNLETEGQEPASETETTDVGGRFRFTGLPQFAVYLITVSHEEFVPGGIEGICAEGRQSVEGITVQLSRGGTLRGRLLDETGRGIQGGEAWARLEKREERPGPSLFRSAPSDADGTWQIGALPSGSLTVGGYTAGRISPPDRTVSLGEGEAVDRIDFVLSAGETFLGWVLDSEGRPVEGAEVELSSRGFFWTQTDAEGRFRFQGLLPGKVVFTIVKEEFVGRVETADVPGPEAAVRLMRKIRVRGRVSTEGEGWHRRGGGILAYARTPTVDNGAGCGIDSGGNFSLLLEPGEYFLAVHILDYGTTLVDTVVHAGETRDLVIPLSRGGSIRGRLTEEGSHRPVDSARVWFDTRFRESDFGSFFLSGGMFDLSGVPEGEVVLTAFGERHAMVRVRGVRVKAGETTEVNIALRPGQGIRGVATREGNPIPGARVIARAQGGGPGKEILTAWDGLYELDGLAPGLHDLTVEGRGPRGESLRHQMTVEVEDGQFAKGDLDFASVLLVGTVASGTGPFVGVRVRMWARLGFFDDMEDTDAAGRFRLRLPRPGSYHLRIDTPGGSAHDFDLTIPEGESEVRREFKVP